MKECDARPAAPLAVPDVEELLLLAGLTATDLPAGAITCGQAYGELLRLLTGMRFEEEEAKRFWGEILLHHQGLFASLGRDVGVRVAVCDYFLNLHPKLQNPVIVEVQVLQQKEQAALLDPVTGLYNRRYFNDAITREVERFKRFGQWFSLLFAGLDGQSAPDAPGTQAVFSALAQTLRDAARPYDHVTRFSPEVFALILPHTDATQAKAAAERMRLAAERTVAVVAGRQLSVSFGVATFPEDAMNARDLVARADDALEDARRNTNTVCAYAETNRRYPRTPLSLMAFFNTQAGGITAETVEVTALNISLGGMLCTSPVHIKAGTRVELVMNAETAGAPKLEAISRVVRSDPAGPDGQHEIALTFELNTPEERRDLVRLVEIGRERLD